jgi:dolichol-phosphate mannosyltransferase
MTPAVVIPTFNEATNLEALVAAVLARPEGFHVWVVDDNSPDGTGPVADALAAREPRVHVIHRSTKDGRGGAVWEGLCAALESPAKIDLVIEMDADFSHHPDALGELLAAARTADVVVGSRYRPGSAIEGWPLKRRVFSRCANLMSRTLLRLPLRDLTNGYRVYSRPAAEALAGARPTTRGFIVLSESAVLLHRRGFKMTEVPIRFVNRQRGQSSLGLRELTDAFTGLLRLWWRPPASPRPAARSEG